MSVMEEGGEYTEEVKEMGGQKMRIRTAKSVFANPYVQGCVEYWLYGWICSSETWQDAFNKARDEKMRPGWDADNRTAAEHYIFMRGLREETGFISLLMATIGGWAFPPIYQMAKNPCLNAAMIASETKPTAKGLFDPEFSTPKSSMYCEAFPSAWQALRGTKTSPPSVNQLNWEYRGWQDSLLSAEKRWFPYGLNESKVRIKPNASKKLRPSDCGRGL